MKSLNDLVNILLLAVLMLMVLILTVFSFGLTGSELLQNIEGDLYQNTAAGLIFLVIFLLTAWALYPLFKTKNKVATISSDEHGSINITLEALDNMIRGIVREEKGLEIKSTELNSRASGMEVQMRIAVEENQNIPVLTGKIRDNILYRLNEITGAEIEKVQILIESISPGKRKPDFISEPSRDKSVREKDSREEKDVKKKKEDREIDKSKPEKEDEEDEKKEKMGKKSSMDKILDKFRKKESKTGDEKKDEDSLKTGDEAEKEENDKDKGPDKNNLIRERDKEENEKDKNEKKSEAKAKNEKNEKKEEEDKEEDKKDYLKNKNISEKGKGISLENSNKNSSEKNKTPDDETPDSKIKDSKDSKDNDEDSPRKL